MRLYQLVLWKYDRPSKNVTNWRAFLKKFVLLLGTSRLVVHSVYEHVYLDDVSEDDFFSIRSNFPVTFSFGGNSGSGSSASVNLSESDSTSTPNPEGWLVVSITCLEVFIRDCKSRGITTACFTKECSA